MRRGSGLTKLAAMALAVIALLVAGAAEAASAPAAPAAPTTLVAQAKQLLQLVNADRAAAGLAPLGWRDDVAGYAVDWSQQMAASGTLSHNDLYFSPSVADALDSSTRGENVQMTGSVDAAEYAFMQSPHHRANILDPRFTDGGFGVVQDATGALWITQDFVESSGAPAPTPTPDPAPEAAPAPEPEPDTTATTAAPAPEPAPQAAPVVTEPPAPEPAPAAEPSTTSEPALVVPLSAGMAPNDLAAGPLPTPAPSRPTMPTGFAVAAAAFVLVDLLALRRAASRR